MGDSDTVGMRAEWAVETKGAHLQELLEDHLWARFGTDLCPLGVAVSGQ